MAEKTFPYDQLKPYIERELTAAPYKPGWYVCPICGSGLKKNHTPACKLNSDYSIKCFSCDFKGDIFDLYVKRDKISEADARQRVAEKYGSAEPMQRKAPKQTKQIIQEKESEPMQDYTNYISACAAAISGSPGETYMKKRGFTDATLQAFKIGYDAKLNAIVIPYPGENYYITRSISGKEYRKPKGSAEPLFNSAALDAEKVFLCEGQLDAISIIQAGGAACAYGGAGVRKLESAKISGKAYIVADNDAAGERTAKNALQILEKNEISAKIVHPIDGIKDVNEMLQHDAKQLQNMVADPDGYEYAKTNAAAYAFDFLYSDRASAAPTKTGFKRLDETLNGGLFEGLYCIGAVSSLGKTTFALQIADQIAHAGNDVLFFSLEMMREELMAKSISRMTLQLSRKPSDAKTVRGITDPTRREKFSDAENELVANAVLQYAEEYAKHIWIDEADGIDQISVDLIEQRIEDHISITGRKPVVFIDYLQLLASPDPRMSDKQATDKNVFRLKRISRKHKIPIVVISSLNRDNYTQAINMAAYKESGAIEYSSDVLIGLQPQGMEDGGNDKTRTANAATMRSCKADATRQIELVVLKNRHGQANASVNYEYAPAFNLFKETN